MPTYDYKCNSCDYLFEELQSMKDEPLKICPKCNKESLQRLIGAGSGMIFKGSGFYLTDYKSSGDKTPTKETTTPTTTPKKTESPNTTSEKKS